MQYVNGYDISNYSVNTVLDLAFSKKIPWKHLENESDESHSIYSFTSKEKNLFLDKGVSEFSISPENMYDLLYNVKLRKEWDMYCSDIQVIEKYDHLNHIIRMKIINPLGIFPMNIFRSCKYDPRHRVYVIAMRSIGLEEIQDDTDSLDFLPNGWVIEAVNGFKDKCRLTFVQQCHLKDLENQEVIRYKSFHKIISLDEIHYLSIFPSTVSGRLGKIFECIRGYITLNLQMIHSKDTRLSIISQTEKEVNEMFGISPEYGWSRFIKKYDMEILYKRTTDSYMLLGKGSFSSVYTPFEIAELFSDKPWAWDTFFDNGTITEAIDDENREVMLYYRMWHKACQSRVVQSVKKGPGNCSTMVWRSISESDTKATSENDDISIDFTFLPSGLFSYGLQQGTYTSFLVSLEIRGAKSANEEELFTKLFAARIISTSNNIVREMSKRTVQPNAISLDKELPIIPTIQNHCDSNGFEIGVGGIPKHFRYMVELFANIVLSSTDPEDENDQNSINKNSTDDNNTLKNTNTNTNSQNNTKLKRKRERDSTDENSLKQSQQQTNDQMIADESTLNSKEQEQLLLLEKKIKEQTQEQKSSLEKQMLSQETQYNELVQKRLKSQKQNNIRLTIKMTNNIITNNRPLKKSSSIDSEDSMDHMELDDVQQYSPVQWTKKQPFLFLMSENETAPTGTGNSPTSAFQFRSNNNNNNVDPMNVDSFSRRRLTRKEISVTNSDFDRVPEEIVQNILSFLSASDILTISLVCKKFKSSTDSTLLWKYLYQVNPLFKKSNPKKMNIIQSIVIQKQIQLESNALYKVLTHFSLSNQMFNDMESIVANQEIKSMLPDDFDLQGITPDYLKLMNQNIQKKLMDIQLNQNQQPNAPNDQSIDDNNISVQNGHSKPDLSHLIADNECKICNFRECTCDTNLINWKSIYMEKLKLEERWNQCRPKKVKEFKGHSKAVRNVKCQGRTAVSFSSTCKGVRVWNVNSGEAIANFDDNISSVVSFDFDYSKRCPYIWPLSEFTRVRVGHKNGSISHYDFTEQQNLSQPIYSHRTVLLADGFDFSMPGKFITWEKMKVEFWDEEAKAKMWTETRHTKKINDLKILQSTIAYSGLVCTASSDKTAIIQDLETGNVLSTLTGHTKTINCIEQIGDTLLLTASADKTIKLWDFRNTQTSLTSFTTHNPVRCVSYEEKGGRVITGDDNGIIKLWNLNNWDQKNSNKISVGTFNMIGEIQVLHENQPVGITGLSSNENGFVCGLSNGNIRRYDF